MTARQIWAAHFVGTALGLAWHLWDSRRYTLRYQNRRLNLAIEKQGEWMTYLEHKLEENGIEMDEFDLIAFNKILEDIREGA